MACLLAAGVILAQDLSLEKVLENHYNAIGQDKMSKVQTFKMTGKAMQMGMEFPMTIIKKRPNMTYTEAEVQGMKIISAFDGQNGWMIMPFGGSNDPQDLPAEQLKSAKEQNIDGMLYAWKEGGRKLELIGKEDMDDAQVYNIKVTTSDSTIYNFYIDAKTFLISKMKNTVLAQGQNVDVETNFSDYRDVNGIKFAYKFQQTAGGQAGTEINFDTIELDPVVDDHIFAKPTSAQK